MNFKEKINNIHKKEISAIYMEGKDLVFLSTDRNELFRGHPESKKELVPKAFKQHRYPWEDKDPYENQYQRWVAEHPAFPPYVNALLSARERAVENDEIEEAKVLRKNEADHDDVIRDEAK